MLGGTTGEDQQFGGFVRAVLTIDPSRSVALAALLLIGAACSPTNNTDETLVDPPSETTTPAPDTTTTATTTETTTTVTVTPEADIDAISAVWTEFIQLAAAQTQPERVAQLSTGDVPALAAEEFFDPREPQTFYPQITIDGDTATIQDCSLFDKPLSEFHYIPINGAAQLVDSQWKISDLEINNANKCIPGNTAAEILNTYEAYWEAQVIYRNPPDPESPLILQLTTGERTTKQLDVLQQQVDANLGWRGRPTTHPEFIDLVPGKVLISDCQLVDPISGLYDLTTGERSDRFDEIVDDQRDRVRSRLEFVDGRWKVAELGATRDVDCEFGPTATGIPVVGPTGRES